MSTWKSCRVCPFFHRPSSSCYRRSDEAILVEDPSVVPAWCPQEDRDRFPGVYSGSFPYIESKCLGCPGDHRNRVLPPMSCQNHIVRPYTEECGECPYHGVYRPSDIMGLGYDDLVPRITQRMAEIIMRGINEGDLSYWEVDITQSYAKLGFEMSSHLMHEIVIRRYDDGRFGVRTGWEVRRNTKVIDLSSGIVTKAELDGDLLFLYDGPSRFRASYCATVRIVDGKAPMEPEEADDDAGECCGISAPVCVREKARVASLEAWL